MKINQAELDAAIETISEGGTALGVSCDDVYEDIASSKEFMCKVLMDIHSGKNVADGFAACFEYSARTMLLEALRAKMENENGL